MPRSVGAGFKNEVAKIGYVSMRNEFSALILETICYFTRLISEFLVNS